MFRSMRVFFSGKSGILTVLLRALGGGWLGEGNHENKEGEGP